MNSHPLQIPHFWIFPQEYLLRGNSKIRLNASLPHLLPNPSALVQWGVSMRHRPQTPGSKLCLLSHQLYPTASRLPEPPQPQQQHLPQVMASGILLFLNFSQSEGPHCSAPGSTKPRGPRSTCARGCPILGSPCEHLIFPMYLIGPMLGDGPGSRPGHRPRPVPALPHRPPHGERPLRSPLSPLPAPPQSRCHHRFPESRVLLVSK